MRTSEDEVAITGMACVYPGAGNLGQFWHNIQNGVDSISDMPASGWDRAFYDPSSARIDRIPCRRGGFIDAYARFDPLRHGVMPSVARSAEPDQLLALEVASRALEDAGYGSRPTPKRSGVIVGRATIIGPGHARMSQYIRAAEQLTITLRELLPNLDEAEVQRIKDAFQKGTEAAATDSVIGLVPNLLASRIANRFDFSGPAYTLDAACASSLVAVDQAYVDLRSGRADLMICGGVHICRDETFWSVFAQLGALSSSAQIRPFDQRADGLLIGEGLGLLVLKRKSDALRDGDRIYAVIRGTGTSSDGRGASLVSPRVEGQLIALDLAWRGAARDPSEIGLLEAHGTATPTGDETEVETIGRFFNTGGRTAALGSIKSMIGHTMPAAGAAGLIKAVLAVHHGVLPPTLHCEMPREDLEGTRFRTQQKAARWEDARRIAAVNAFGFGGVNAHVVVESLPRGRSRSRSQVPGCSAQAAPALFAASSVQALLDAIDADIRGGSGPVRLGVLDPTPEKLARARQLAQRGVRVSGALDTSFTAQGLLGQGGKTAFLFPGFDASFSPRIDDLLEQYEDTPDFQSLDMVTRGKAILWVNAFMHRTLIKLGVAPDAVAGHSLGDVSAMTAAGMLRPDEALPLFEGMKPGSVALSNVVYVAAGCSVGVAEQVTAQVRHAVVSHDNCPHQTIVCAPESEIALVIQRFGAAGVVAGVLPFRSGMHTPYFEPYVHEHTALVRNATFDAPSCRIYSATTCAPYPKDADAVRRLLADHLVQRVRFRELIERMYADDVRVFVQVGTGGLVSFVNDTLRGLPHLAISANVSNCSGREQLLRALLSLWVEGADIDPIALIRDAAPTAVRRDTSMLLNLGVPLVHFEQRLPLQSALAPPKANDQARPWSRAFQENLEKITTAQRDVVAAMPYTENHSVRTSQQRPVAAAVAGTRAFTRVLKRAIGFETYPGLIDHTFHKLPPDWCVLEDHKSVMPLTGLIALIVEAAQEILPNYKAIEVRDVVALRWLGIAEPFELEIRCAFDGKDQLAVELVSYARGTVTVANAYPERPAFRPASLERPRPSAISARELYAERMMFHGPAYQGIIELGPIGDNGIRGRLRALSAPGALLDSAAQVLGYWVMQHVSTDRLTIPASVKRVRFYGPHPAPGQQLECLATVTSIDSQFVQGCLTVADASGVWADVEDWIDRRVPCDEHLWNVIRFPERRLLSHTPQPGLAIFNDYYRDVLTRDYLSGQYLVARERASLEAERPRDRRAWLSARIAARDAVRHLLAEHGVGDAFPVEVALEPLGSTSFRASLREYDSIWVVFDRVDDTTVAVASLSPKKMQICRTSDGRSMELPLRVVHGELTIGVGP